MTSPQSLYSDDQAREMRIGFLTMRLHTERSQEKRREVWEQLQAEIKGRSSEQVEKMEIERGLR